MSLANVLARSQAERESWHYTNLSTLLKALPQHLADVDAEMPSLHVTRDKTVHQFVFVDGVWQVGRSHLGNLSPDILQGDAVNGYRLVLAGQTCLVTSPIELLFMTTGWVAEAETTLHIELGSSGRLTLIERHQNAGHATTILNTHIDLHPQAKFVHGKIISGGDAAHLAMTKVHVAEGGFYDNFTLIKGGRLTRNEIETVLNGKMSQCTLNGVMLLRGHEHADTTTRIIHNAPYGTSREIYKTVLAEQSHGVFQGKIIVAEDAQKTDGHQLSRALLLSDQSEMNAKPELEIYADDVKCSHGSTIGDLDADALFYLRARGLNEAEARGLLIQAFVGEIIDEIPVPEWRDACRVEVEEWLDEQI